MTKWPTITATTHVLPFLELSPLQFEQLCFWVVTREGFKQVEHIGAVGSDFGQDIIAWKGRTRYIFQCKRVRSFSGAECVSEVSKATRLLDGITNTTLIFILSCAISPAARKKASEACSSDLKCEFWPLTP